MKRIFIPALMLGLTMSSCGSGNSDTVSIKPEGTKISGSLGNSYEVINKDYKIDVQKNYPIIAIAIKRKSDILPFDPNQAVPYGTSQEGKSIHVGFGIELLDKDGNSIETVNATASGMSGVYSSDDIQSIINLQNGETGTVRWSVDKELISKAGSFRILSAMEEDDNISTVSSPTENTTVETDANDWDEALSEYEAFIDDYIATLKKVKANDMSAMADYPELMRKAEIVGKKLEQNQDQLTKPQMKKFIELQTKLSNAAVDLM